MGKKEAAKAYKEWLKKLRAGRKVRVRKPWDDGKTPGGEVVSGKVIRVQENGILVAYAWPAGFHTNELFNPKTGCSGPYANLLPLKQTVYYDPVHGRYIAEEK